MQERSCKCSSDAVAPCHYRVASFESSTYLPNAHTKTDNPHYFQHNFQQPRYFEIQTLNWAHFVDKGKNNLQKWNLQRSGCHERVKIELKPILEQFGIMLWPQKSLDGDFTSMNSFLPWINLPCSLFAVYLIYCTAILMTHAIIPTKRCINLLCN